MRVWFDVDRVPHGLDAVEDDLDAILIPIISKIEQGVIGRLALQEDRVVHTHSGVLWVLNDGRTRCNQSQSTSLEVATSEATITYPFILTKHTVSLYELQQ